MRPITVINARGAYTPLGVSRSPPQVARAAAKALQEFVVIDEMLKEAGQEIAGLLTAEAATLTHCTAASLTLAVAATICGLDKTAVLDLPQTRKPRYVILQHAHVVDYGQPIEQAIRLCGAAVKIIGSIENRLAPELAAACAHPETACLVLVESRLTKAGALPVEHAVEIARGAGIPVILDAAAQTRRIGEILAYGADLTLFSGQKYLGGPTAGVVVGRQDLIVAVELQTKGIGRAMKPTKESIAGTLAAFRLYAKSDVAADVRRQQRKLRRLRALLAVESSIETSLVSDVSRSALQRLKIRFVHSKAQPVAPQIVLKLKQEKPAVFVFEDQMENDEIFVELTELGRDEIVVLAHRLLVATRQAIT